MASNLINILSKHFVWHRWQDDSVQIPLTSHWHFTYQM